MTSRRVGLQTLPVSPEQTINNTKECETIIIRDTLLGFTLPLLPDWMIGLIFFAVMMFGFIANGMVEEGFKYEYPNFSFGWFMTSFELIFFTTFTIIERLIAHYLSCIPNTIIRNKINGNASANETKNNLEIMMDSGESCDDESEHAIITEITNDDMKESLFSVIFNRQMHWKYHMIVATAMLFSRSFTNISLLLLNYPTQVIFKTMKLISVMIGNRYWLKKKINSYEIIAAPALVLSAILFTVGDSVDQLNFHMVGIAIVLISLIFDAIHANSQEKILDNKKCDTKSELLIYSNMFGGIMAAIASVVCMETAPLIQYLYTIDVRYLLLWFFFRVFLLYVGVSAYVGFTKKFGVVRAVMITTIRKILTVFISFFMFPNKIFTGYHSFGVLFFCFALIFQVLSRKK